jgi:hypothetical protein
MAVTLTVGTNSWCTLAEANAYLEEKPTAGAWAGLSDTVKKQWLITAYRYIFRHFNVTATVTTNKKYAQIELAWWFYLYYTNWEKRESLIAGGVTKFKISRFEEELDKISIPHFLNDLLPDSIKAIGENFFTVERDND